MSNTKFEIGEIVWYTPAVIYAYEKEILAIKNGVLANTSYLVRTPNNKDDPQWVAEKTLTKKVDERIDLTDVNL